MTSSCSMFASRMNTRRDVLQMLSTCHVRFIQAAKTALTFFFFSKFSLIFLCVGEFQCPWWTSLWGCPQSSFSSGTTWRLLGKRTTTLCFTAGAATEVWRLFPRPISWVFTSKWACFWNNFSFSPVNQRLNGKIQMSSDFVAFNRYIAHIGSVSRVKWTSFYLKLWSIEQ